MTVSTTVVTSEPLLFNFWQRTNLQSRRICLWPRAMTKWENWNTPEEPNRCIKGVVLNFLVLRNQPGTSKSACKYPFPFWAAWLLLFLLLYTLTWAVALWAFSPWWFLQVLTYSGGAGRQPGVSWYDSTAPCVSKEALNPRLWLVVISFLPWL